MTSISDTAGYDTVLEWLANIQQEQARLKKENADLRAQLAALMAGQDIHVVVAGVPFSLTTEPPTARPVVAFHVVPDFNLPTMPAPSEVANSFLLGDTGEQPIFEPKSA